MERGCLALSKTTMVALLLFLGASAVGCQNRSHEEARFAAPTAMPVTASDAAAKSTPIAVAPAAAATADLTCPSAVVGAKTRVKDADNGVEVVITAKNVQATKEIRRRANKLAALASPGMHGSASALSAACAVRYVSGAGITVEDIKGGVRVWILSSIPGVIETLRKTTPERAQAVAKQASAQGRRQNL